MKMIVKEIAQKKRLDVYLSENIEDVSRSFLEKLCEQHKVMVNGAVARGSHKLHEGDIIEIDFDFEEAKQIPEIDLPIIYEDEHCIVICKPEGVLTHSKGAFNPEATVATFIADKIKDMPGDRGGIVHRLDRATSGVILCAKNPEALQWFQKQFSARKVKKTYYAIVSGLLEPEEAIIDIPIERNPRNPKLFRTSQLGKPAQTHYSTVKASSRYSMVELHPYTGRTHQLRVHLQHLKHPIVGDPLYGGEEADRMYLHAAALEITLPNSERLVFEAPVPESFTHFMEKE